MPFSYYAYLVLFLVTAVVSVAVAIYALLSKNKLAGRPLGITMLLVGYWAITYAMELAAPDLDTKIFWVRLEYPGIAFSPFFWLVFAVQYTGRSHWLNFPRRQLLAFIPFLTVFLVFTNDFHSFYWTDVNLVQSAPFMAADFTRGWGFWIFIAYTYCCLLGGAILVAAVFWKRARLRDPRSWIVFCGAVIPWILNALYVFHMMGPLPDIDMTPLTFTITGILIAIGLFRYQMLDLVPVARESIFESMGDGVLILDTSGHILDANRMAAALLGRPVFDLIGNRFETVVAPGQAIFPLNHPRDVTPAGLPLDHPDIIFDTGNEMRSYSVQFSQVRNQKQAALGYMVMWRDITDRKKSEEALRRQYNELRILQSVAAACSEASDEDRLVDQVTRVVGEAFYPDNFGLLFLDEASGGMQFHRSYRDLAQQYRDTVIPLGRGITGVVAATGVARRIADVTQDPDYFMIYTGTRSELCVPVKIEDRPVAVINAEDRRVGVYTAEDERLLDTIAGQLATAIGRLRIAAAERRWTETLATLYQASQEITSSLDATHIYTATHRAVARLMPVDVLLVALLDAEQPMIHSVYFQDSNGPLVASSMPAGRGMSGRVIETGKPLRIADIDQYDAIEHVHIGPPPRSHSILAVPLQFSGRAFGVLAAQSYRPGVYSAEDEQTLATLANQVAIAIENARLFHQERMRASQIDALNNIVASVAAATDLEALLNDVLQQIQKVMKVDGVGVRLRGKYANLGITRSQAERFVQAAVQSGWDKDRPLCIPDWQAEKGGMLQPLAEYMTSHHVGASITTLIPSEQDVLAGITVVSNQPRLWSGEEVLLVDTVGRQLGVAAERMNLMEGIQSRLDETTLLSRVISLTATAVDIGSAMTAICAAVAEHFHSPQAGFALLDPDETVARVFAEYMAPGRPSALGALIPVAGNLSMQQLLSDKQPLAILDARTDPLLASVQELMRFREVVSILLIPILIGGKVVGTLGIDDLRPRRFSSADINLMKHIASQISQALERLRLFTSTREYAGQMALLADLGSYLNRPLTVDEVAAGIGMGGMQLSQARRAAVYTRQPDATAGCLWFDGLSSTYIQQVTARVREMPGGQFFISADPVLISSVAAMPDASPLKALAEIEKIGALALWPLVYEEQVIAGLGCYYDGDHEWSASQKEVMLAFARQAAVALKNASLFEETRRRSQQVEALNAVISAAASETDITHLLNTVLDLTLDALGATSGAIWVEGQRVTRRLPEGFGAINARISGTTGLDLVQTLAVDDWQTRFKDSALSLFARQITSAGLLASLTVPVMAERRRIGGITLFQDVQRHWLADEVSLVEAVGGQVGSAVERLNLVDRIRLQAHQMQQIMDTVPDGVILLDQQRTLILANPAAKAFLVHLLGEPAARAVVQQRSRLVSLGSHNLDEIFYQPENRLELETGSTPRRVYQAAARALSGSGGAGWVLVLRDVTQERDTQAHIQMQDRLATVGQLAAGIAHDFNNIMSAVVVYTDLLMMEPGLSRPSLERLAVIQKQVQRASSLIRQILDFSRRSVMEQSQLDLLPFIKELDRLLDRVLPETIRMELTYQPGAYTVKADPTRLQQVFMNLALNARDAMPFGGVLRFEMDRFDLAPGARPPQADLTPGRWVRIRVRDSGTGIPPDVMKHIFEPFFTTKPVGQGTGLGLAQVYGIIKQHGGSIDVESRVGEGTSFTIYLAALDLPDEEALFIEAQLESFTGYGETILLVEDDVTTRDALKTLLATQNYQVIQAANGMEALRLLDEQPEPVSLIITDLVMPEMGGLDLYNILVRRQQKFRVLFVTGHPLGTEAQALLEDGRVCWLQKPFAVREFSKVVRSLLDGD